MQANRIDLWWAFRQIGAVMTALALASLVLYTFSTWSITKPMMLVLDAYRATVQVLLGWTEPYIKTLLSQLSWKPELAPSWRDTFVATSLFLVGLFTSQVRDDSHWFVRYWSVFWAWVLSFLFSVFMPARDSLGALLGLGFIFLVVLGLIVLSHLRKEQETALAAKKTALFMLTGILGAALFFAADAGAKLLGGGR